MCFDYAHGSSCVLHQASFNRPSFITFRFIAAQPRSLYSWLSQPSNQPINKEYQIAFQLALHFIPFIMALFHFSMVQSTRCPCCASLRVVVRLRAVMIYASLSKAITQSINNASPRSDLDNLQHKPNALSRSS